MIKKILEIALGVLGWILLFSTIFFICVYFSFHTYKEALSLSLTLFIGLLTAACTLGAVWAAIYALSDKVPRLLFEYVSSSSHYNSFIHRQVNKIRIRIQNSGGKALNFKILLKAKVHWSHNKYSITPQFGYDEIYPIEDKKDYFLEITINGHKDVKLIELIDYLKFELTFSYVDKFHNNYEEVYVLKTKAELLDIIKIK